jgi:hypothetical protein
MRTLGIQFEEGQLDRLREQARQDRRSVGFLVRDAIDLYLEHRNLELSKTLAPVHTTAPENNLKDGT